MKNGLTEFCVYTDAWILMNKELLICGDFNFHVNNNTCKDAASITTILTYYGLKQHINVPTYDKGHTLGLIISRSNDSFIEDVSVKDALISHHFWLNCVCQITCYTNKLKYRNIKKIIINSFNNAIENSSLGNLENVDSVSHLMQTYNKVLSNLLDEHTLLKKCIFTVRHQVRWYTSEIAEAKRASR